MKWISNKTLFNIHGWLGLNLGLFLFVICFSGSFATLSSEVDWLLNTDMRVDKQKGPTRWEAMHQSIEAKYPEGRNLGIYKNSYSGNEDYFAAVAYVSLPNGQNRKVYLDPYTGQIKGDTSFFNVQRFFRSYHRRFFDGERGIFLVTLSSFFLLFSALTGFLFYKGWLKNLFKLRLRRGVKAFFSDIHKQTGVWSLIFTLLIALTGVFYFAELMIQADGQYEWLVPADPPAIEQAELAGFGAHPELLPLDQYVANAHKAFPELDIRSLRIPHSPNEYVYIDGQAGNPISRNRANRVYLHPFTGQVVHLQYSSGLSTAHFITDIADPLHFGYFGGLPTKIIWFVFGLAISFAILTGTYLWYIRGLDKMKRKLKRRSAGTKRTMKSEGILAKAGFFLEYITFSRGAVISTIAIVVYLTATGVNVITDIRSYGPLPEERIASIQSVTLGPWNMVLECEYPCSFREGSFLARFNNKGIPNYTALRLEIITAEDSLITLPFAGDASRPSVAARPNLDRSEIASLQLVALTPEGKKYSETIPVGTIDQAYSSLSNRYNSNPEKAYPRVPWRIYLFISFFGLATTSILIFWCYFLARATSKQLRLP